MCSPNERVDLDRGRLCVGDTRSATGRTWGHRRGRGKSLTSFRAGEATAGIVQNHPFIDGNKRTGFVICVLFLELNGYRFTASEEAAAQAALERAAGAMDEKGFCEFLRANSSVRT